MSQNKKKVFISHSSKDREYGEAVVKLLLSMGLEKKQIIFTSNAEYGIPLNVDIFQYLKEQIHNDAHMLYLLSDHYYESIACMNEMGAAWVMQNHYTLMLLPGFDFNNRKFQGGVANANQMAVKLDDKYKMRQLSEIIAGEFALSPNVDKLDKAYENYFKEIDRLEKLPHIRIEKKLAECEEEIQKNPQNYNLYWKRGKLLMEQDKENYRLAIRDYLYASFLSPKHMGIYVSLMEATTGHEEYTSLLTFFDWLCERFPEVDLMYGCRAYVEYNKQHYMQSIEDCNKAILLSKGRENRWYYNTRGRCYRQQGEYESALKDFLKAHELDSTYQPAVDNIKIISEKIGLEKMLKKAMDYKEEKNYEKCKMYLEAVLIVDPENKKALLEYGGLE